MKTKGGVINIYSKDEPNVTPAEAFTHFIANSNIVYFSSGSFGMIFKATLNDENVVSKYEKFEPTEGFSPLREMLIKLIFLHENDDDRNPSFSFFNPEIKTVSFQSFHQNETNIRIESLSIESFRNEANIQVDIHEKSYDYGMPLCPSIIFSEIFTSETDPNVDEFINNFTQTGSKDNGKISQGAVSIKNKLIDYLRKGRLKQIGIIAMEFANNYSTLDNLTDKRKSKLSRDEKTQIVDMALYSLIELYKLGYTHGDHHGGNILINPNYEGYFYNIKGRPLIIDFGRTQLLENILDETTLKNLNDLYNKHNYIEILIRLNSIITPDGIDLNEPYYNHLFGFAAGKYNLITDEPIEDFINPGHTNEMIGLLLEAHKQRIEQLETEGDTIDRENNPRTPIYPIASAPKDRGLTIYKKHIGGIMKRIKKSKNRKQSKKGKKGKRTKTNRNKNTKKRK